MLLDTLVDTLESNQNLFIELNDGQQEIVSGGGQLIDFDEGVFTEYLASETGYASKQSAGPDGATNVQMLDNEFINTYVDKAFSASFD
ncbi:MAG: CTB family bacteriocin [Aphanocapsa sp. GSE-SYN-MK-11-07L]|jgi:hypothetical protein|nr:CTB family bacteriocin [Aphanocapsa sp. GSE-SYN-MK-11-07L]